MRTLSLFSGCGGMDLGFKNSGFDIVQSVEIDDNAGETLRRNFDHEVVTKSVSDIKHFPKVDVVIGGPPCQSFSLAGSRGGVKDPRGAMMHEFIRVVRDVKPKFFVLENVMGLLSADKGTAIENILSSFPDEYSLTVHKVNSVDYGVPQTRRRVIITGSVKGPVVVRQTTRGGSVKDAIHDLMAVPYSDEFNHVPMKHTQRIIDRFKTIKQGQSLKDVQGQHMQRARGDSGKISGKVFGQNNFRMGWDGPAPTICASFQSNFIHPELDRNITAREAARLQTFPDSFKFMGARTTMSWEKGLSQYQQIGNAVPVKLAEAVAVSIKEMICRS